MGTEIPQYDAQSIALGGPQRWAGNTSIVGPGREADARGDLDLLILGPDLECPQSLTARQCRERPGVPVGQLLQGVKAVPSIVHPSDRYHVPMDSMDRGALPRGVCLTLNVTLMCRLRQNCRRSP